MAVLGLPKGHLGPVHAVAFSPDGQWLATGGGDKTVKLWNLARERTGDELPAVQDLNGHSEVVWSLQFSPDGKLLASGSLDQTIILWDAVNGTLVRTLKGHAKTHSRLAFSPDGQTIAAGQEEGTVRFWDVATGIEKPTPPGLPNHRGPVRCVAYSPDGKLFACSGVDKKIQVYDTGAKQIVRTFTLANIVDHVAFSPDGKLLGATTDSTNPSTLNLWELAHWKQSTLPSHHANVPGLAFSPVAPLAATSGGDGIVRFWDLKGDAPRTLLLGPGPFGTWAADVVFTPDGHYRATANYNNTVTILRVPATPRPYQPGPPLKGPLPRDLAKKTSPADALGPDAIPKDLLAQANVMGGRNAPGPGGNSRWQERPRRPGLWRRGLPRRQAPRIRVPRQDRPALGPGHRRPAPGAARTSAARVLRFLQSGRPHACIGRWGRRHQTMGCRQRRQSAHPRRAQWPRHHGCLQSGRIHPRLDGA